MINTVQKDKSAEMKANNNNQIRGKIELRNVYQEYFVNLTIT